MSLLIMRPEPSFLKPRRRPASRFVVEALEGRTLLTAVPTSISVAVSSPALLFSQQETITATISVPGNSAAPNLGTVTFLDGGQPIGQAVPTAGVATLTTRRSEWARTS